jgi:hypothetical protein
MVGDLLNKRILSESAIGDSDINFDMTGVEPELHDIMFESVCMSGDIDSECAEIDRAITIIREGYISISLNESFSDFDRERKIEKLLEGGSEGIMDKIKSALERVRKFLANLWLKVKATVAAYVMDSKKFAEKYIPIAQERSANISSHVYTGYKYSLNAVPLAACGEKILGVLNGMDLSIANASKGKEELTKIIEANKKLSDKEIKEKFVVALMGGGTYKDFTTDLKKKFRSGADKPAEIKGFSARSLDEMAKDLKDDKIASPAGSGFEALDKILKAELEASVKLKKEIQDGNKSAEGDAKALGSERVSFYSRRIACLNKGIAVAQMINSTYISEAKEMLSSHKKAIASLIRKGKKGETASSGVSTTNGGSFHANGMEESAGFDALDLVSNLLND